MAQQVTELSVFVASPSDVEEERNRLEDVIRDLNLEWWNILGIRLELVKWETHAYPDFGDDVQSVINKQIRDDYDIFIGIMWCIAGTPTQRADSGTIEEFQLAKKRYDAAPDSVRMLFYFKDAPISPSQLDPRQMPMVADFRASLGKEGGLYWTFKTVDEFARFVRLHLTRHVEEWRNQSGDASVVEPIETNLDDAQQTSSASDQNVDDNHDDEDYEEELGLLDLEDEVEDEFFGLREVTERIAYATVEVGEMLKQRTAEIQNINEQATESKSVGRKALRRVIANAAADMGKYVTRMEAELPLFTNHLEAGVSAFTKAIPILVRFSQADSEDNRKRIRDAVTELREIMLGSENSLDLLKSAVSSTPSMTTVMNRARRATAKVIQRQMDAMRSAQLQLAEVESLLEKDLSA